MEFKDTLRDLRTKKGMTLQEVADYLGLQKAAIYKYEHGLTVNPKRSVIEKLATLFQVSPSYLLGISGDTPESKPHLKMVRIPILGKVVAGNPKLAVQDIIGWTDVTPKMARSGKCYGLYVKGHSMEPQISDGELVIVRCQTTVDSGQVAIVLVGGNDATCKQVKKSKDGIMLIGFNPAVYTPHFYSNEEIQELPVTIIGRVVESRRSW